MQFDLKKLTISFSFDQLKMQNIADFFQKRAALFVFIILSTISIVSFIFYYQNTLGLAYNDARSHLDIGRRVVENLKPGFSQLGSVWLPLPHFLMTATIWNDFMWHSGLSGALQSMISFVATGLLIYFFLKKLQVDLISRLIGVLVFALNINILYLQSTAMTELLLLATMTAGVYELMNWYKTEDLFRLIKAGFWVMLSTLVRYDGWFLFLFSAASILLWMVKKRGFKAAEGVIILFCTLGGFGIFLWFLWNQMIFKDPLYFAFGPYSAHAQQAQLEHAGVLATKHNLIFSLRTYFYAVVYNSSLFIVLFAWLGAVMLWLDKKIPSSIRVSTSLLFVPFVFNVVALYLGHSVLFVQGLAGESWFNVRYGVMMIPSLAIFFGYLVYRLKQIRIVLLGLFLLISFFSFANHDAVSIDDAVVGASGKNVGEVSGWVRKHALDKKGYVLISVASHDAIIFSSGLPMSKFIHEGTGKYWTMATDHPSKWARWIIMRTHDRSDTTYRMLEANKEFEEKYTLVNHFPFADIYELKPQYVSQLQDLPKIDNHE